MQTPDYSSNRHAYESATYWWMKYFSHTYRAQDAAANHSAFVSPFHPAFIRSQLSTCSDFVGTQSGIGHINHRSARCTDNRCDIRHTNRTGCRTVANQIYKSPLSCHSGLTGLHKERRSCHFSQLVDEPVLADNEKQEARRPVSFSIDSILRGAGDRSDEEGTNKVSSPSIASKKLSLSSDNTPSPPDTYVLHHWRHSSQQHLAVRPAEEFFNVSQSHRQHIDLGNRCFSAANDREVSSSVLSDIHGFHRTKVLHEGSLQKKSSGKKKRVRTIFTSEQLERLEAEFERQQYMVGSQRYYLATSLNLTEAQVKVWFQNRRIKWRKQTLDQHKSKSTIYNGRLILSDTDDNQDDENDIDSNETTDKLISREETTNYSTLCPNGNHSKEEAMFCESSLIHNTISS